MITVRRAAERYLTDQPGIVSRHCFAAGPHYDPANTALGPLVGVDEHLVEPGAGFAEHAHRGVCIVSWVLEGTLRHEIGGTVRLVGPGELLTQDASAGLRHGEGNPAGGGPLRFVQTTWLADAEAGVLLASGPIRVDAALIHLYLARGSFRVEGRRGAADVLEPGDSLRADEPLSIHGAGELLIWRSAAG